MNAGGPSLGAAPDQVLCAFVAPRNRRRVVAGVWRKEGPLCPERVSFWPSPP